MQTGPNDFHVDRAHAHPIAPHTLRRQVERFVRPFRRMAGSGAYGPRCWLSHAQERRGGLKVLLSWELPAMLDLDGISTVVPMESVVTEIDSEYTLNHARRNFRSREAISQMQALERATAINLAAVQAQGQETNEQAADWLATGKTIKNTRIRRDISEWDAGGGV